LWAALRNVLGCIEQWNIAGAATLVLDFELLQHFESTVVFELVQVLLRAGSLKRCGEGRTGNDIIEALEVVFVVRWLLNICVRICSEDSICSGLTAGLVILSD
jgi:hypothetical protein